MEEEPSQELRFATDRDKLLGVKIRASSKAVLIATIEGIEKTLTDVLTTDSTIR